MTALSLAQEIGRSNDRFLELVSLAKGAQHTRISCGILLEEKKKKKNKPSLDGKASWNVVINQ